MNPMAVTFSGEKQRAVLVASFRRGKPQSAASKRPVRYAMVRHG
jgi:hypothetical protein